MVGLKILKLWIAYKKDKYYHGKFFFLETISEKTGFTNQVILKTFRPQSCPHPIYEVMRLCWATNPDDRPPFRQLKEELMEIAQTLQMD